MSDQASQAAMRAAGAGEDARWRVMPRFGPWVWGLFTLIQVLAALTYLVMFPSDFAVQSIMHSLLAGLGVLMCVLAMSWTAAGAHGLRIHTGWQTYEIPWDQIASIKPSRMGAFRLATRSGTRRVMQGVNRNRVGLLLYLWEHYRGPDEPQRAMGDRGRQGLWQPEPQRYLGARVGVILLPVVVTLVVAIVAIVSSLSLWVTVPIGAVLLALAIGAVVRVMLAGTVLRPDGVKVRTPATSRRVPWSAVHQVAVTGREVAVVTNEGPVTLIGVPAGEVATIERFRAQGVAG